MVDRRTLLTALPASSLALAIPTQASTADPIVSLYRDWLAATAEWRRLADIPGNEDFDWPESIAAENRAHAALLAMVELTPTTVEGIAALSHILWSLKGPAFRTDHPEYAVQCQEPSKKALLALWRATSGRSDHPPVA